MKNTLTTATKVCSLLTSHVNSGKGHVKVTGYLCARRPKCIGKCILKLANQKSRVRRA